MGIIEVLKIKFDKLASKAVSTEEILDYSFDEQRRNIKIAKAGMTDLAAARIQFEKQLKIVNEEIESHKVRAKKAVEREDMVLAEALIGQKIDLEEQARTITEDIAQTVKDEAIMQEKILQLETNLRRIKLRNEKLKTQSKLAATRVKANEMITGMSKDQIELSSMIDKTIDKTAEDESRADALEELAAKGVFIETGFSTQEKYIDPEERKEQIQNELKKLQKKVE